MRSKAALVAEIGKVDVGAAVTFAFGRPPLPLVASELPIGLRGVAGLVVGHNWTPTVATDPMFSARTVDTQHSAAAMRRVVRRWQCRGT